MRLDQELVKRALCDSRSEAQELILNGKVIVNSSITNKLTKQITEKDTILVTSRRKFVSRGGEKLEGIMNQILGNDATVSQFCLNKRALDIGSSTGGFSDYLLQHNIGHIDAIDVGTSQLHDKVRSNDRVNSFENTDIRDYVSEIPYDIIVADLSFVSLELLFTKIVSFGKKDSLFFLLIKPQFEVGKGNTKKGIVKDIKLVETILKKYKDVAESLHMNDVCISPCVIEGGDGNQEYFLYGKL